MPGCPGGAAGIPALDPVAAPLLGAALGEGAELSLGGGRPGVGLAALSVQVLLLRAPVGQARFMRFVARTRVANALKNVTASMRIWN